MKEEKIFHFLNDQSISFEIKKNEKNGWLQTIISYLYRLDEDYHYIKTIEQTNNKLSNIEKIKSWKIFDSYINNMNKYLSLIIRHSKKINLAEEKNEVLTIIDTKKINYVKKCVEQKLGVYTDNFKLYRNKFAAHHLAGEPRYEDLFLAENINIANPISFCSKSKRLKAYFSIGKSEKKKGGSCTIITSNLLEQSCISITQLHEEIIGTINIRDYLNTIDWSQSVSGL